MKVEYEAKNNKFLISCDPDENILVAGLPDRNYRKIARVWAAPALRKNIEYMEKYINNPCIFSKEALKAFNDRRKELAKPIRGETAFPPWYVFKGHQPMPHQTHGLEMFYPLDYFGMFYEQGLGKTFTSIHLAAALRMTNKIDAVVVGVPSSIKLVWEDEIPALCPIPAQVHALESGKYKACDKFIDTNNEFPWLIFGIEGLSQGNAKEYIERFMQGRRVLFLVDEASTLKNPFSNRTEVATKLARKAVKRGILTGTSITKGLEDLYSLFYFLSPDILGYNSFYTFRARYCKTISIDIGVDHRGRPRTQTKIVGYQNEDELMKLIRPFVHRVEKKDALDLPEKVYQTRLLKMSPEQHRIYKEMEEDLYIEMYNLDGSYEEYEAKNILEKMLRLQQIAGGHYPFDDGEKVTPKVIPGKNPKIEELMNILDESDGKVVIWCQWRCEITLVSEALEKAEIQYVEFVGGMKDDEKKVSVQSFRRNPRVRVFLCTSAAAYGLTLTEAWQSIYYSPPRGTALEVYEQSQDRIHRIGQMSKNGCLYIHLAMAKTYDEKVIKVLRERKGMADLLYSMMKDHKAVYKNAEKIINAVSEAEKENFHEWLESGPSNYDDYAEYEEMSNV